MTNTAHLFFSYAHADDKRMIPLHARMQAAVGHNLWIDKVGLTRGIEWEDSIHRAIDDSYGVLFAITSAFVAPERVFIRDNEIPWTIDRFRKVQGPVIFPILFEDVMLPPALDAALHDKDLQYLFHVLDFRDGDEKRLFDQLKAILPTPSAGNHPFIIDWPRLPNFQGRDQLLIDLHDKLKGSAVGIKTAGLHGMGGIGKTQLAVEYAHRYRFHYPAGVYWVNAARADWTAEVAEIAERLGLQPPENAESGRRESQLAAAFERHLKDLGGDALLILDNVENPADVPNRVIGPKLRFTDLPARLLITTRRQDLPANFAALPVNLLPPADAHALLLDARPDAAADPAIDAICQALGYLPLALGLAAAALKKRASMKPAKFLEHLQEKGVDAIAQTLHLSSSDLGAREDYVILLDAALDWHWNLIGENARHIIALAAAYGEAAELPLARLRILSGLPDDPDDLEQPFTDALTELRAASLIESLGEASIRLHPLVRDYVRRAVPDFPRRLGYGAKDMVEAYHIPQVIFDQSALRGFGALINDLNDTAEALIPLLPQWSERGFHFLDLPDLSAIRKLARLFDWEGHHLRSWKPDLPPEGMQYATLVAPYLIQSIRERAHHQSDDVLRDASDSWLKSSIYLYSADAYRFPYDSSLIRIIEGHESSVNDVVVLPDGERAISASSDKTLRLWDIASGHEIRRFDGHTDWIRGLGLLPDGKQVMSASSDKTLRLWDIASGHEIRRFDGHTDRVRVVTILPNGEQAISAADDHTLRLWDITSGREIRRFDGHTHSVRAVCILPGGKQALSASVDHTLRLWDITSGREIRRFDGHNNWVRVVTILPDGEQALSAADDHTLRLWDITSGREIRRFDGYAHSIRAVCVLPDGERALSASSDKTLRLWDIASGREIRRFDGHTAWVRAVCVLPDGERALSASSDQTLRLWDIASGREIRRFDGHNNWVTSISVLSDGKQALSASSDKTLRLWDIASGREIRRFEGHNNWVTSISVLSDGKQALSASSDKTLRLWDIASGREIHRFRRNTNGTNMLCILPDGKRALSVSSDRTLRLWDIASGHEIQRFDGHTKDINAVSVLPDGERALSASSDRTLRLWDIASGHEIQRFDGHTHSVRAVCVLPGGEQAVSASYDKTLRLWDIATGREIHSIQAHTNGIRAICITPDGKMLFSASYDQTLRAWDITTKFCLAVFRLEEIPTCLTTISSQSLEKYSNALSNEVSIFVGSISGKVRLIHLHIP